MMSVVLWMLGRGKGYRPGYFHPRKLYLWLHDLSNIPSSATRSRHSHSHLQNINLKFRQSQEIREKIPLWWPSHPRGERKEKKFKELQERPLPTIVWAPALHLPPLRWRPCSEASTCSSSSVHVLHMGALPPPILRRLLRRSPLCHCRESWSQGSGSVSAWLWFRWVTAPSGHKSNYWSPEWTLLDFPHPELPFSVSF